MPFVDEEYVLNWLKSRGNLPADVVLEAVEAEDDVLGIIYLTPETG